MSQYSNQVISVQVTHIKSDTSLCSFCCSLNITLFLGIKPVCAFFVYVSPQTFAGVEAMGSSVPQLLEDPKGEPGRGSPVSNPASANTTTNPESVGHNTDLQVCVSLSVIFSLFFPLCLSDHILFLSFLLLDVHHIICLSIMTLQSLLPVAAFLLTYVWDMSLMCIMCIVIMQISFY